MESNKVRGSIVYTTFSLFVHAMVWYFCWLGIITWDNVAVSILSFVLEPHSRIAPWAAGRVWANHVQVLLNKNGNDRNIIPTRSHLSFIDLPQHLWNNQCDRSECYLTNVTDMIDNLVLVFVANNSCMACQKNLIRGNTKYSRRNTTIFQHNTSRIR